MAGFGYVPSVAINLVDLFFSFLMNLHSHQLLTRRFLGKRFLASANK